jgi:hypothetical protein
MNLFALYILFVFPTNQEVYLYFDPSSKEICTLQESQIGRFHSEPEVNRYEKILQVNGSIDFFLCKEMFQYKVSKHTLEKGISSSDIRSIKFSNINDLLEEVQKNNPLYPNSLFNKIYIYEKQPDGSFIKFEVAWEYYIE